MGETKKPSRRDVLKFVGTLGAGAAARSLIPPGVREGITEQISEGATALRRGISALDKDLRKYDIYRRLAEGKVAARLDKYGPGAGVQVWQALLEHSGHQGTVSAPRLLEDGSVELSPGNKIYEYSTKSAEVKLSYDANPSGDPRVWIETQEGTKIQIAPYRSEFTNSSGQTESGVYLEFLDEKGQPLNMEGVRGDLGLSFLYAVTKEMTERRYGNLSTIFTFSNNTENDELLNINFAEVYIEGRGFNNLPIIRGTNQSNQEVDYYKPELTKTGIKYFTENDPRDIVSGKIEPLD